MRLDDDPSINPDELRTANERHDLEHGNPNDYALCRVRPSWNPGRLVIRKRITDRKIDIYAKAGWYSDDFREARRELAVKKAAKHAKREGNFVLNNGRMVYSPLNFRANGA